MTKTREALPMPKVQQKFNEVMRLWDERHHVPPGGLPLVSVPWGHGIRYEMSCSCYEDFDLFYSSDLNKLFLAYGESTTNLDFMDVTDRTPEAIIAEIEDHFDMHVQV